MPSFSNAFSQVVNSHREAMKLSKAALARKADLHQTYIGLLEKGVRSPNLDTAKAIANALEVPLSKLIEQSEELLRAPLPESDRQDVLYDPGL